MAGEAVELEQVALQARVFGRFAGLQDEAVFEHAVDARGEKWFFVKYFSTFFKYKFLT